MFSEKLKDLGITEDQLQHLNIMCCDDPVMSTLRDAILRGWPESKFDIPEAVHPYFDFRDELTIQDQL